MDLILTYGVPIVALMIFISELGIPTGIPTEIACLVVGSHSIHTGWGLTVALIVIVLADLAGTTLLFTIVQHGGSRVLRWIPKEHAGNVDGVLTRWQNRVGDRAPLVVFFGRLVPFARMPITIGVALIGTSRRQFLAGAIPSSILWGSVPVVAGYIFRNDVQRIEDRYEAATHVALFVMPAILILAVVIFKLRRSGLPFVGRSRTAVVPEQAPVAPHVDGRV